MSCGKQVSSRLHPGQSAVDRGQMAIVNLRTSKYGFVKLPNVRSHMCVPSPERATTTWSADLTRMLSTTGKQLTAEANGVVSEHKCLYRVD